MSKLHDHNLMDREKPLYVFEDDVICDRLIDALESFHNVGRGSSKPYYVMQLVPTEDYFISYRDVGWSYSEKINITQEQVDKYLILYDSLSMSFLEYMEILYEELKDLTTTKYTIEE